MSVFQNIQTKRKGLACPINVMNHSGHDVLTTYDPQVDNSVEVATQDLQEFMQSCIAEFEGRGNRLKPNVFGKRPGQPEGELDWIGLDELLSPDFSLEGFTEIMVQPVPLTGG